MKTVKRIILFSCIYPSAFGLHNWMYPSGAAAGETAGTEKLFTLEEVIVTAPAMEEPLTVATDPKSPRQPVPANEGAGYLKNIPGFSVTRKGGGGGDPVLRGLGGSRLNILLDGAYLHGGCGGRMDPPTAYVYPESYDRITVLKGPETVLYGGGNVSGTVLFERNTRRFEAPGFRLNASAMAGSWDRNDQMLDFTAGGPDGFLHAVGTRSDSNNYEDGDGNEVHSFHTRKSITGILGWTPDDDTRVEVSVDGGEAESAYADRTMDGVLFDRRGYQLKITKENLSPLFASLNLTIYTNYIDHVMDNYSLRAPSGMAMANNPDRDTTGGRISAKLLMSETTTATLGLDYQKNEHTFRSGGYTFLSKPRVPDMTFENIGVFGEIAHDISAENRILGGLRADFLQVDNEKPGSIASDDDTLHGAFLRYEHDFLSMPVTAFVGFGLAQRPADWWERNNVFFLHPERNSQVDAGLLYSSETFRGALSLFYARIDDFIMLTSTAAKARNIDATTYGVEADAAYSPIANWTISATLASVRGENDTDGRPLPQIPPLEATLGITFDNKIASAGISCRAVSKQDRYDVGNGGIIGRDIGETPGFTVMSANASYRPLGGLLLSAGIDNIFDTTYAEHISKAVSSSMATLGLNQTVRVNEPGRAFWLKASYSF